MADERHLADCTVYIEKRWASLQYLRWKGFIYKELQTPRVAQFVYECFQLSKQYNILGH